MNRQELQQILNLIALRVELLQSDSIKVSESHPSLLSIYDEIGKLQYLKTSVERKLQEFVQRPDVEYKDLYESDGLVAAVKKFRSDTGHSLRDSKKAIDEKAAQFGWIKALAK